MIGVGLVLAQSGGALRRLVGYEVFADWNVQNVQVRGEKWSD
jgi:hypothetical protein